MLTIERDRDTMETNRARTLRRACLTMVRLHRKALARRFPCELLTLQGCQPSGAVAMLVENLRLYTNCVSDYEEGLGLVRGATFA